MESICRLCITTSSALTSVFSFKNERLITDMISIICPIKIDPSDDYPKNICKSCLKIITDAYDLREKSVHSDYKLRTEDFSPSKSEPENSRTSKRKSTEVPDMMSVKVENNPYTIEFVDENYPIEDDQDESGNDYDDNEEEIIPMEPNVPKKSKYQKVRMGEIIKIKCMHCDKIFSNTQNAKRHMMTDHDAKVETSTVCRLCGAVISHKFNLKRHYKNHHPEYEAASKIQNEHLQEIINNSSELTRKIFATPKKQWYMEYITVISLESDNCFKYQCLVCAKETGKSKIWSQSISNGGTSNIRRHLTTSHPEEFKKLEDILNGKGLLPLIDDVM